MNTLNYDSVVTIDGLMVLTAFDTLVEAEEDQARYRKDFASDPKVSGEIHNMNTGETLPGSKWRGREPRWRAALRLIAVLAITLAVPVFIYLMEQHL